MTTGFVPDITDMAAACQALLKVNKQLERDRDELLAAIQNLREEYADDVLVGTFERIHNKRFVERLDLIMNKYRNSPSGGANCETPSPSELAPLGGKVGHEL